MKLTLVNQTSSESLLTDVQQGFDVEEIEIADPKATLLNVRATAAIRFKINITSFWLHFDTVKNNTEGDDKPPRHVDLSNEKQLLSASGLQDGDTIVLYSQKRSREQVRKDYEHYIPEVKRRKTDEEAPAVAVAAPVPAEASAKPMTTTATTAPVVAAAAATKVDTAPAVPNQNEHHDDDDADEEDDDPVAASKMDLYSTFFETVPNLIQFRKEFLADPQGSMLKMQKDNPALFQLIAANQEAWLELINDENTIKTIQEDQTEEIDLGESPDEEMDEAQLEEFNNMLMQLGGAPNESGEVELDGEALRALLQGGDADEDDQDDDDDHDDGAVLGSDADDGLTVNSVSGPNASVEKVLAYVPSEDDEKKIQDLVQLGFSYNQCKVAFYRCLRSVERAANLLFEQPPQV